MDTRGASGQQEREDHGHSVERVLEREKQDTKEELDDGGGAEKSVKSLRNPDGDSEDNVD